MKKYIFIILCICVCVCLGFAACSKQYEDTNGSDNFTLQSISDQNIINLETGASGLNYTEENWAGVISSAEYSASNFNGVEQIFLTNYILPSDVEVYIGHMNVKSGNFRLVAICDDEIIHEFALDAFNETIRFEDLTGAFSIHVAGESAKFEFSIEVY